jgi:hypothetical protein
MPLWQQHMLHTASACMLTHCIHYHLSVMLRKATVALCVSSMQHDINCVSNGHTLILELALAVSMSCGDDTSTSILRLPIISLSCSSIASKASSDVTFTYASSLQSIYSGHSIHNNVNNQYDASNSSYLLACSVDSITVH